MFFFRAARLPLLRSLTVRRSSCLAAVNLPPPPRSACHLLIYRPFSAASCSQTAHSTRAPSDARPAPPLSNPLFSLQALTNLHHLLSYPDALSPVNTLPLLLHIHQRRFVRILSGASLLCLLSSPCQHRSFAPPTSAFSFASSSPTSISVVPFANV